MQRLRQARLIRVQYICPDGKQSVFSRCVSSNKTFHRQRCADIGARETCCRPKFAQGQPGSGCDPVTVLNRLFDNRITSGENPGPDLGARRTMPQLPDRNAFIKIFHAVGTAWRLGLERRSGLRARSRRDVDCVNNLRCLWIIHQTVSPTMMFEWPRHLRWRIRNDCGCQIWKPQHWMSKAIRKRLLFFSLLFILILSLAAFVRPDGNGGAHSALGANKSLLPVCVVAAMLHGSTSATKLLRLPVIVRLAACDFCSPPWLTSM